VTVALTLVEELVELAPVVIEGMLPNCHGRAHFF
jgi:hypothetical protein